MAFLRNLTTGETRRTVLNAASDQAKDDSAQLIRHLAAIYEADLVFTIMDACGLPRDKVRRRREIVERYGSIGTSPYRIDFVSFALESRHGIWVAQVPIKPKGISKKRRTFGFHGVSPLHKCRGAIRWPAADLKIPRGRGPAVCTGLPLQRETCKRRSR
jgi:hypothetical protein